MSQPRDAFEDGVGNASGEILEGLQLAIDGARMAGRIDEPQIVGHLHLFVFKELMDLCKFEEAPKLAKALHLEVLLYVRGVLKEFALLLAVELQPTRYVRQLLKEVLNNFSFFGILLFQVPPPRRIVRRT